MAKWKEILIYIGVILFVFFIIGWGIVIEVNLHTKKSQFIETSGGISSYESKVETDSDGSSTLYAPVYTYMVDMQYYSITGGFSSNRPKVGKTVTIYYNPDNYGDAICLEEESSSGKILISVGLGFLIILIGFLIHNKNNSMWVLGLGITILGGGIMFSIPGFAIWKIVIAVFPLIGLCLIIADISSKTGLDKKYKAWKKKHYPNGFKKPEIIQETEDYLKEDNRGERIVHTAGTFIVIVRAIPFIIIGLALSIWGLIFAFDLTGIFPLIIGLAFMFFGIKTIVDALRR